MINTNEDKGSSGNQNEQIILMKVDYAFKYVMRNEDVTRGFIAAVLGVDVKDILYIEYLDTNTEKDGEESKLGIMDLLISMNGNKRINIEIQLNYMKDWINRSLFYISEGYFSGCRSGRGYSDDEVPALISINILDFIFLKNENRMYNEFRLMNRRSKKELTDKIDIHIIELKKLESLSEEEERECIDIIRWARFISANTWEEYEKLGSEDDAMAEAVKELKKINADEIERLRYLHREMALRDEYQYKREAEERGKEIGEKKGEESAFEIVDKLLSGMSVQEIISEGYRKEAVLKAETLLNKRK